MDTRLKKKVTLCRSGIQLYSKQELLSQGIAPKVDKDWYREFRPASVLIEAQDLMRELPVTVEHPEGEVAPENFKDLIGGYTSSRVKVISLGDGEVGIESDINFGSKDFYDYFNDGNHEVSLGYVAEKKLVDNNPDYDLILTKIVSVNHLALTKIGRGGSKVSVHDSRKGGNMKFYSKLFNELDSDVSVTDVLFDLIEKGGKRDKEGKRALDMLLESCPEEVKNIAMDSLEYPDMAIKNKEKIVNAINGFNNPNEEEEEIKDTDGRGANTNNIQDSISSAVKIAVEEALKEKGLSFKSTQNDSGSVVVTADDIFSVI